MLNQNKIDNYLLITFSIVISALLILLTSQSSGLSGGSDSYGHYLIAKNSWNHPSLFLDQWGKPLYNLIASPFAQFGLNGVIAFNILCLLFSGLLVYKISRKLRLDIAFLGFLLTILSPVFLDNTISSLTEPLCALLVILTVYLFVFKKYTSTAILAGFLPYARSEGFIVLGIVALILILFKNQYKVVPYLFVGSVFLNTLGWIIDGDPFWVVTQNPYINFELSGVNICGNGGLFHYLYAGHYTFGFFVCIILLLTVSYFFGKLILNKKTKEHSMILIIMIFLAYFGAHVFIWWKGMMGSCGYVRVMTVIAPVVSLIVVYGMTKLNNLVFSLTPKYGKIITKTLTTLLIINTIYTPYRYYSYRYPLAISEEQEEYHKLLDWYKNQNFEQRTKIYLYPYFSIIADIDPYNQKEHLDFWASSLQFTKKGDILIWDSHFGPNESGTPLADLESNKSWKKINKIIPEHTLLTMNNQPFEIHVFEKIE
jgi:hypothetical protein